MLSTLNWPLVIRRPMSGNWTLMTSLVAASAVLSLQPVHLTYDMVALLYTVVPKVKRCRIIEADEIGVFPV